MRALTTADAVYALRTGIEWYMYGDDLSTLRFLTPNQTAPTQAEVDAWLAEHA